MPPKYKPGILHDPLHPGPWRHRFVAAHGARFHLAELGDGPLVVFLHGHHSYWWLWNHQLTHLAHAGYRTVALDLRGFGASDKPPRGYDLRTMADDVAGVIRALGGEPATLVALGAGRCLAHLVAATQPDLTPHLISLVPEYAAGLRQRPVEPRTHRFERDYQRRRTPAAHLPKNPTTDAFTAAAALPFTARSHKGVAEWMGPHAPAREASSHLAHIALPPQVAATRYVVSLPPGPSTPWPPTRAVRTLVETSLARTPLRVAPIPAAALTPFLLPDVVNEAILTVLPPAQRR